MQRRDVLFQCAYPYSFWQTSNIWLFTQSDLELTVDFATLKAGNHERKNLQSRTLKIGDILSTSFVNRFLYPQVNLPTIHQVLAGIQVLWGILPAHTFQVQALCGSSITAGHYTLWLWSVSKTDQKESNSAVPHAVKLYRIERFSGRPEREETEEQKEEIL